MAASDSDSRVADEQQIDLVACQTDDGHVLFHDPTLGEEATDVGRWIRVDPDDCVDLGESC